MKKIVRNFFGPKTFDPEKCCSLKKNCSKNFFGPNMFWYNVEKGSKNCLERVKLRVSEVSDPPQKTVGLNLFLILVASAHIPNSEPLGPLLPLFVWVGLT